MPSEIFQNLSDSNLKALTAYLRSVKPVGHKLPAPQFSALDKQEIASGKFEPAVQKVAEFRHAQPMDLGPPYALGRYITSVTCEECHGSNLEGKSGPPGKPPNLVVAGGYTRDEFERLITRSIPSGNRKLKPAMRIVAQPNGTQTAGAKGGNTYAHEGGHLMGAPDRGGSGLMAPGSSNRVTSQDLNATMHRDTPTGARNTIIHCGAEGETRC